MKRAAGYETPKDGFSKNGSLKALRFRIFRSHPKTLLALFAGLGTALLCAAPATAGTVGVLNLNATVEPACSIAVAPTAAASDLDVVAGEINTQVATVSESCNDAEGYTVTVETDTFGAGSAALQGPDTYQAAFSIKYNGDPVTFTAADTPVNVTDTEDPTQGANNVEVLISVPAGAAYVAGSYTAALTFTIAAK